LAPTNPETLEQSFFLKRFIGAPLIAASLILLTPCSLSNLSSKTGSGAGFLTRNRDRLLDMFSEKTNFRQERKKGFLKGLKTGHDPLETCHGTCSCLLTLFCFPV